MAKEIDNNLLISNVVALLIEARKRVLRNVNLTIVQTYFEIGRLIVEDEQHGGDRADYGKEILKLLSDRLSAEFGKGFSEVNLRQMRAFYLAYSIQQTASAISQKSDSAIQQTLSAELGNDIKIHDGIGQTVSDLFKTKNPIPQTASTEFNLSYSHYLKLMRIADVNERKFYEIEAFNNNWSLRELQRQFDTALYTRLSLSRDKAEVLALSQKGLILQQPKDAIKDPYILEFIGLPEKSTYSESDLETRLIDKLEEFLLELGTGFTFVARQKRITIKEKHYKIDLVFYNRILKCFVLIDLKIGELSHQDLGQLQMYVNYYDRKQKLPDENKTIGIILCHDKDDTLVEMTLPENNEQIFASRYLTVLPSKEDLKKLLTEN